MPGRWKGLREIESSFRKFDFAGPKIQSEFLQLIGDQTVQLLKSNTPVDSGELANSWKITGKGRNFVEVGSDLDNLAELLESGIAPHIIEPKDKDVLRFEKGGQEIFTARVFHPGSAPNRFLTDVNRIIGQLIIKTLESAMRNNHRFFADLRGVGGKGRRFQQVGRTSAGFKGGTSSRGRSKLVRAGTGRRQLKRRLALRRRTAAGKKKRELKTKLG